MTVAAMVLQIMETVAADAAITGFGFLSCFAAATAMAMAVAVAAVMMAADAATTGFGFLFCSAAADAITNDCGAF